jgi:DNA-binding GntR family transcriptional regulator
LAVPRGRTAHAIASELKRRIARWELAGGCRLTEEEISAEFGVSRSPVREALRLLASDGYVTIRPRTGYLVRQPSIRELENLYEVRLALELLGVERLARAFADGRGVDELLPSVDLTASDPAVADRHFHEQLSRAAGNVVASEMLATINDRLHVFREIEWELDDTPARTHEQHEAILSAIRAGDAQRARSALQENVSAALENIEHLLGAAMVNNLANTDGST